MFPTSAQDIKAFLRGRLDPERAGFWNFKWGPGPVASVTVIAAGIFSQRAMIQKILWLLSTVNIRVHEYGHPIFGLLLRNEFLMALGGTAMQLLVPAGCCLYFLSRRSPKSSDFCLFWLGQNLLDVGQYVADARAHKIPLVVGPLMLPQELVRGNAHDWTYLLGRLGLLQHDILIGGMIDMAGCLVMGLALWSLSRRFRPRSGQGEE